MAQATLTRVLKDIQNLEPKELELVLQAARSCLSVASKVNEPIRPAEPDAWTTLEGLMGTVSAPEDWSEEHDHYLVGAPKRRQDSKP